jgi:hypothetical protein
MCALRRRLCARSARPTQNDAELVARELRVLAGVAGVAFELEPGFAAVEAIPPPAWIGPTRAWARHAPRATTTAAIIHFVL